MNHPFTHWLLIWQVETAEPMEDDETFVSYPIVIPTGAEEPLSCSPTGPNCLSNQLDSMNFDRWVTYLYNLKWRARAIFVWPWKMVSVSVRYLFYQPMDEKIKTWPLRFPAKENPNTEKHCSIGRSCCRMTSKRSIGWFLQSSRAWSFFTRAFA